jgi:hypothetical protein
MSDPDAAPDPIDKAYIEAEAVLNDDAARAARRARVLAAVAREPIAPLAAVSPSIRRPAWRRGGWLAAASVAVLGMFVATHIYQPTLHQPPTEPTAPVVPAPAAAIPADRGVATLPAPSRVPSHRAEPAPRTFAASPQVAAPTPPNIPSVPPPPPLPIPPAPHAFPSAPPAPAPPPPSPTEVVVTAERRAPSAVASFSGRALDGARGAKVEVQRPTFGVVNQASSPALAAVHAAAPLNRSGRPAGPLSDQAGKLRAAAATGLTAELETLLAQGVPVDAADADGNTALMRSIQTGQPAAAALLRRHGASLDAKNHAGTSAKDMAKAKGDPALNQALDLAP